MTTPVQDNLRALAALQQIDTQIQRARRTQAGLDNGTQATADAQAARQAADAARDAFHRLAAELKDNELKEEAVETKRKSYQQRLYQGTVTNPKELSNMEREIEALGRQRSDLDGRILELMERVERAQEQSNLADETARVADTHRAAVVSAFQARHEALELEMADATRRRAETAAQVLDRSLLKRYDDIRTRAGGVGIAAIQGADCGGCHMTLSASQVKAVKEGQEPQTCENCGRLLTT